MTSPPDTLEVRRDRRTPALVAVLVLGSLASLAVGLSQPERPDWVVVFALSICAAVGEWRSTVVAERFAASAVGAIGALAAVVAGPVGAWVVGTVAMAGDLPALRSRAGTRWLAHASLYGASCAVGGLVASSARSDESPLSSLARETLLASALIFCVNFCGNGLIGIVRRIRPLDRYLRTAAATIGAGCLFAVPVVIGLAYGYRRAGLGILLLILIPLLASSSLFGLYRRNSLLVRQLSDGNLAFALALMRALDARDAYTAGHSAAVAVYARDLARASGYGEQDVAEIQLAALLHDVGKIGVPSEVLNKVGRLSDQEWLEIRRHPEMGERITGEAPPFRRIAHIIRHHHERPDGRGYPDGLRGDEIPVASGVIGIADAYNAMTSPRVYRSAMSPELAIAELVAGRGTQFSAVLVDRFLRILTEGGPDYQTGVGPEFSVEGHCRELLDSLRYEPELVAA